MHLALAMVLIVLGRAAVAQAVSGVAAGTVTDTAGTPVAGAKVVAMNFDTGIVKRVMTDDRGNYAIDGLRPGAHKIRISAPSHMSVVFGRVQIEANSTRRVDAKMQTVQPGQDGDTMLWRTRSPASGT
jgi:protocatechuate 3,4-dioxygenase beta subunit